MPPDHTANALTLGPILRHVGEDVATVWVQTRDAATVTVRCDGRSWSSRTFGVHGYHYALVHLDGLTPGSVQPYAVDVDGEPAWPPAGSPFPPSRIATLDRHKPVRLAFGSCRTSVGHDAEGNASDGIDALRAYAVHLARDDSIGWPDLLAFLGDQVYADEDTPEALTEFIAARRDVSQPPGPEVKDYVEYDHLYQLAWSDPAVRWILSTIPSTMIFDDHDVRDDWNTSWSWRREIRQEPWWHERIVSALASYWVYQHIGNLAPKELDADALWQRVVRHEESEGTGELDLTAHLEALAARADALPDSYRWSYARDLGSSRLVVVDSRAARELSPDRRSMLDPTETAWLQEHLRGDCRHLFIGTSLPFLLPPGLHDLEAISEVAASGRYGRLPAAWAERLRRAIDLEHWAAFDEGFFTVLEAVLEVARGERGSAPETITFLSGDVHNSYLAEIVDTGTAGARSRILQAVCSPMRNPMPRAVRVFMSLFAKSLVRPMRFLAERSGTVPVPAYRWQVTRGPWFDNNIAVCEVTDAGLDLRWYAGRAAGEDTQDTRLRTVAAVLVGAP